MGPGFESLEVHQTPDCSFLFTLYYFKTEENTKIETKVYIIAKIDGEYAYLKEANSADSEQLFIALYLLPQGSDIGTRLFYNFPDFTIIE